MSTVIRPETAKSNPYYIPKQRYYELKHFCLQYHDWRKAAAYLTSLSVQRPVDAVGGGAGDFDDPTWKCVEARAYYQDRMKLVEDAAMEASPDYWEPLLVGVTTGRSYEAINTSAPVPCSRDEYYKLYRRFFWILSQSRG